MINDEDFEEAYQQSLNEMQAEDFCSIWYFLTVLGRKPVQVGVLLYKSGGYGRAYTAIATAFIQ